MVGQVLQYKPQTGEHRTAHPHSDDCALRSLSVDARSGEPDKAEYLTLGCQMCEKLVSIHYQIPLLLIRAATRSTAETATARQVAMYLAHTKFGLPFSEVGIYFGRDRTTVAHGCHTIEDKRDDRAFDELVISFEDVLDMAIEMYRTAALSALASHQA